METQLLNLLKRKGLIEKLDHWKRKEIHQTLLRDIYDGKIWKENDHYFRQDGINLGLMMNIDWFSPFSRTKTSIGAIYLVIVNLPREERFKKENMILVGVIPGPKEPDVIPIIYLFLYFLIFNFF